MAFGLLASTGAKMKDGPLARTAANWLVAHASLAANATGWGLGFEWDAFGDGSKNPAGTVYGITTALAVAGLLDAYEATRDNSYIKVAEAALDYYAKCFTVTADGGYFWYSDQPADSIDVYNVSSMLMGQYARASRLLDRKDFGKLARLASRQLLAGVQSVDGLPYWSYSERNDRPNDAVHAAYTVQGLIEFNRHMPDAYSLSGHAQYLSSFGVNGMVKEFSSHHDLSEEQSSKVARLWGVGMLIFTLVQLDDIDHARTYAEALEKYRVGGGNMLANLPNSDKAGEPRMISHVSLGLAELERSR
jgi:hypothetical protein